MFVMYLNRYITTATLYRLYQGRANIFSQEIPPSARHVKVFGRDYNIPEWGRVPKDWYYTIINVGFFAQAGIPNFDLQALVNFGYMRMITGSQKIEQDGLLMLFPFGVGIGGSIALDGGVVANEASASTSVHRLAQSNAEKVRH